MPELPEVELMVRRLASRAAGRTIRSGCVIRQNGKYLPERWDLTELMGSEITSVTRRGKFILFRTTKGLLVGHNAMSGYWDSTDEPWTFDYVEGKREVSQSDVRVIIGFGENPLGPDSLRFHDTRLFGSLRFYPRLNKLEQVPSLKNLGPEAICTDKMDHEALDPERAPGFLRRCKNKKVEIKHALMTQEIIAGAGNIYVTEALWRAQMNPWKTVGELDESRVEAILTALRGSLEDGIRHDVRYNEYLRVYRSEKCFQCGHEIMHRPLRGRTTYFCPNCQPTN